MDNPEERPAFDDELIRENEKSFYDLQDLIDGILKRRFSQQVILESSESESEDEKLTDDMQEAISNDLPTLNEGAEKRCEARAEKTSHKPFLQNALCRLVYYSM